MNLLTLTIIPTLSCYEETGFSLPHNPNCREEPTSCFLLTCLFVIQNQFLMLTIDYLDFSTSFEIFRKYCHRMSSIVKTALAASIQRLYEKREEDNMADYIIESKDGVQIKVHPLILLSRYLSTKLANRLMKIF